MVQHLFSFILLFTQLTADGDRALEMVAGIDRYVGRALAEVRDRRARHWHPDFTSVEAYRRSVATNRSRLRRLIGVVDERPRDIEFQLDATLSHSAVVGESSGFTAVAVRWPALDGVEGEGLLLRPRGRVRARIIALGDADQTPEMLAGLEPGLPPESQFARRLAERGCEVLVPVLVDRAATWSGNPRIARTNQPHREFLYRMAYQMGRHIIGLEVQKVLAAVDVWEKSKEPIEVFGYGEGGLIALHSAAVDERIAGVVVSGHFNEREAVWREPIYRNVWGLLDEFGDAELGWLVAPRRLVVEAARGPQIDGPVPARDGISNTAAPGRLVSPPFETVVREFRRLEEVYSKLGRSDQAQLIGDGSGGPGLTRTLEALSPGKDFARSLKPRRTIDAAAQPERQRRQFFQLVEFVQRLVRDSERRRGEFWKEWRTSSAADGAQAQILERYRDYFHDEVIGRLPKADLPMNVQMRRVYDEPKWTGYEVRLDVWRDVFVYGVLLAPKDLKEGERRPVVVCQHGLEARPERLVDPRIESVYHSFAAQLADRGFVVFAPQNPYLGGDRFRVLQRKLNPLKASIFSVIVRQHERLLEWLAGLPFVDGRRIGLYGLSYGGKTAMRVPAILDGYALAICSGDFNEWVVKTTSTEWAGSYLFSGEYEIPEFDIGNTFNYAEMAALIAPRPLMVERGHSDPVGTDELVAYEYAKVRRLYLRLGVADRTEIEYFDGRHEIHGRGTFEFLHRRLNWPER